MGFKWTIKQIDFVAEYSKDVHWPDNSVFLPLSEYTG